MSGSRKRLSGLASVGIMVPFARAINPISKTSREGVGVKPDVEATGAEALDKAHQLARQELKSK